MNLEQAEQLAHNIDDPSNAVQPVSRTAAFLDFDALPYQQYDDVHDRIERIVRKSPDTISLSSEHLDLIAIDLGGNGLRETIKLELMNTHEPRSIMAEWRYGNRILDIAVITYWLAVDSTSSRGSEVFDNAIMTLARIREAIDSIPKDSLA